MKKSFKKLTIPALTCIALGSITIGTTFALFTDRAKTEVQVRAGIIDINSAIRDVVTYSAKEDANGTLIDENGAKYVHEAQASQLVEGETRYMFVNSGYATYSDSTRTLALDRITPGDKITFGFDLEDASNVNFKFRFSFTVLDDNFDLSDGLKTSIKVGDDDALEFDGLRTYRTGWTVVNAGDELDPVDFSIELPIDKGNEYQDKAAKIRINFDAVQANAHTTDELYVLTAGAFEADKESAIIARDSGYLHETTVDGNVLNMIGYEEAEGKFAALKQKTYGLGQDAMTYKGMLFNRSLIDAVEGLTVDYTGDDLYYVFSKYLMEDLSFPMTEANKLVSGVKVAAPAKTGYFAIYTAGTALIDNVKVNYASDSSLHNSMIFTKNSSIMEARSVVKAYSMTDSYIDMTNNPQTWSNNYSVGSNANHAYTWYRWNGRTFRNSAALGDDFSIHVTIMGNISQMIDPSSYFNFSVWPEVKFGDNDSNNNWDYAYIGNDNYEPLGHADPNRVHTDQFGDYTYAGRYFTTYRDYGNDNWQFADPDQFYCLNDSSVSFREAYEASNMPFWHIEFKMHVDDTDVISDVFVNGYQLSTSVLYDEYDGEDISLKSLCMHAVNYGNPDGTPKAPYDSMFTYARF